MAMQGMAVSAPVAKPDASVVAARSAAVTASATGLVAAVTALAAAPLLSVVVATAVSLAWAQISVQPHLRTR